MTGTDHSAMDTDTWTTRRLLGWMTGHFRDNEVDSPRVVAEMLLAHVLGCERLRLYMDVDREATSAERARLRDLVGRAARHEPVQYLVGEAWFFSRSYTVDRSVFIPRPCTEMLVEHVISRQGGQDSEGAWTIADVGTGTGCIAIALALGLHGARIIATDVSEHALATARANAERHGVAGRIEFRRGEGLAPLAGTRFEAIVSNPPYVPDAEWATRVDRNVKGHEPESALRAGPEGLDVIRPLLAGAGELLRPGGAVVLEIADAHKDAVVALAERAGLAKVTASRDTDGLWRMVVGEAPTSSSAPS